MNFIHVRNHHALYDLSFKDGENLYAQMSELSQSCGNVWGVALTVREALGRAGFCLRVHTGFHPGQRAASPPPTRWPGAVPRQDHPLRGAFSPREVWELSTHVAI